MYRENKLRPLAAMFFDESWWLEQSLYMVIKETFLLSYNEISPMVYDKKIFIVFHINI